MSTPTRLELESEIYSIVKILGELQKKVELGQISFFTYHEMIREKIRDLLFIELLFKNKGMDIERIIDEMNISDEFLNIIPQIKNYILFRNLELKKNQDIKNKTHYITSTPTNIDTSLDTKNIRDQNNPSGPLKYFNEYRQRNQLSSQPTSIIPRFQKHSVQNLVQSEPILLNNTLFNPMTLAKVSADITSDFITILDYFHMKLTNHSVLFELCDSLNKNLKEFPGMEELAIEVSLFLKNLKQEFEQNAINYADLYSRFEKFYLEFKRSLF